MQNIKIIFWDFDGVIKESVSVKTDVFIDIFTKYGPEVAEKVKKHHIKNSGISRFEKIPIYLKWSGIEPTTQKVHELSNLFGDLVRKKVINCDWVPGAREFISSNYKKIIFIIVSATPQEELYHICRSLKINNYFKKIYGSPTLKSIAIQECIKNYIVSPNDCLMFGDAKTDLDAAIQNNIKFIFRKHKLNLRLKLDSRIKVIKDFNDI